jgi:two-component system sensor histidine kinase BaeS
VNGLLTLSRSDAGLMGLDRELCDLADVARRAVAAYAARAADAGVALALDAPEALLLEGDPDRLRELADILLDNALRHAPRGSTIAVHVGEGEGRPALAVSDAGAGLSAEVQARVFERFYRADGGRARDAGGLGLGLSIARAIAQAHDASLTVRSTPGAGATFTLELPAQPARAHVADADVG